MMRSIIYISRNLLVLPDDSQQLSAIHLYSVARNRDLDLTGLLIVSPQHFAQYLEGDGASLDMVMASIGRDCRHTDLVAWEPAQLPTRRFPNWRMALFGPDEQLTRAMNPILARMNGTMPDPQKAEMMGLMQTLAEPNDILTDHR